MFGAFLQSSNRPFGFLINPILDAFIIVVIIIMMFALWFDPDENEGKQYIKFTFYSTLFASIIIMYNNHLIRKEESNSEEESTIERITDHTTGSGERIDFGDLTPFNI